MEVTAKTPSLSKVFLKKLFRNKLATVGLVLVSIMVLLAILAPVLAQYKPNEMAMNSTLLKPGQEGHLLGTDNYGRDLFSRIVYGARISLIVGIGAVAVGAAIGIFLGLIAGYFGGLLDSVIMRFMDALAAFPFILLAITLMTVLGTGLVNVIIAVGIGNIPGFARMIRGQVLGVKEELFIEVTESLGASKWRILFRHVLPNCLTPIIVYATMSVAGAIISEAALSFLGLGIQPPTASWGNILKEGKDFLVIAPHIAVFSGLAILLSVLGLNLFGDGLRDALDPKTKI
ncbi:ABC transporter permease [Enterococcus rivorum]|uniref:Peptide ABC transporter permease n=2 Tax=Enterococcus rivorum TaxID=762845 RepID=A0A1E5KZE4_9ENTE|nr:ABC transporter permease [Enterococcus rivorum]MBP2099366.1 peptide/nickel transport system permease protein [Enterococcus rivorum]OEH83231.1 peptide ABC transporter permease [Enterococcus rivorum]